jgi:dTDP-4-dehydrorhamnose 3,5-epimerase-like enzyme
MSFCKLLEFNELGDERGNLVAIEGGKDIPFEIKRVFYLYGTDSEMVRGQHANRQSQFVLINVSGSSDIRILDGLGNEEIVHLNKPRMGVFIPRMIWKEMYHFSENSVILCLADTHYIADEYIRDYGEYLKIVQEEKGTGAAAQ